MKQKTKDIIGALLLVVFHPGLARAMVGGILAFLSRFRLFRNTEHSGIYPGTWLH